MTPLAFELDPFVHAWLRLLPVCILLASAGVRRLVVLGPIFLSALLAASLTPLMSAGATASLSLASAGGEALLGVCFALVAGAPLLALTWLGQVLDRVLTGASAPGPDVLGRLYGVFGLALFFALGGHRVLLTAFTDLARAAPLGSAFSGGVSGGVMAAVAALGQALAWLLLWAAPFAVSLLLFDVVSALAARFVQRAPLAMAGGPLRVLCALTVLVLGGAFVADVFPAAIARAGSAAGTLSGP